MMETLSPIFPHFFIFSDVFRYENRRKEAYDHQYSGHLAQVHRCNYRLSQKDVADILEKQYGIKEDPDTISCAENFEDPKKAGQGSYHPRMLRLTSGFEKQLTNFFSSCIIEADHRARKYTRWR